MDDTEGDTRYTHNGYSNSSDQEKVALQNSVDFSRNMISNDVEDDDADDDVEIGDEEDDDHEENGVQRIGNDDYEDENEDYDDYGGAQRLPKKRKLKSLCSGFELVPRVPEASASTKIGGRNSVADWTEPETFILLGAWGDKYIQHGRKSLRSEEWQEVAEKVSQESQIDRTDSQCRNRLDTLKKKYKKEKAKMTEGGSFTSKWVYFKKMDSLMTSSPTQAGLSCGVDSGEYAFSNHKDYVSHVNGLDEMRDSPGNLISEEDSEGLPPRRSKHRKDSYMLLANSVEKFSKIYEKIENSKRQQMLELEKMRMDFLRDLELQKRQILQKAKAEIVKIHLGDAGENGLSSENIIG